MEERVDDSVDCYLRALELAPECLFLAVDALVTLGRSDDAAAVLARLPDTIGSAPRIALARVRVLLARGDAERAQALLDDGIELPDIREGTDQLAEVWADIRDRLGTARPLPARYDFGMAASADG